jgi:hypothetical protein
MLNAQDWHRMPTVTPCRRLPAEGFAKRLVAVVIAAVAVAAAGLSGGYGFAETVVISDGSVGSNSTPAIYDALEVYGTNVDGDRSTYNANAPLSLSEDLRAHDAGIFTAGADVTCGSGVSAYRAPGAVPEIDPNNAHGAVMLLVGAAGLLERRLRQRAMARHSA